MPVLTNCRRSDHETQSTDFDTADKLYFEELSYERVMVSPVSLIMPFSGFSLRGFHHTSITVPV